MKPSKDDMRKAYKRDLGRVRAAGKVPADVLVQMSIADKWQRLTEIMLPYALQLTHNYQGLIATADLDFMDLVQEASIATMQAVKTWKPEKGVALTTFVKFHIRGRFSRMSKAFARQVVSIDALIDDADSGHQGAMWQVQEILLDETQNPEHIYRYLQLQGWLDKHSESLPDRQRAAVRLFCGLDSGIPLSLAEVASKMGISSPGVKKLLDKGLRFPD